jgi:hypothetical protein
MPHPMHRLLLTNMSSITVSEPVLGPALLIRSIPSSSRLFDFPILAPSLKTSPLHIYDSRVSNGPSDSAPPYIRQPSSNGPSDSVPPYSRVSNGPSALRPAEFQMVPQTPHVHDMRLSHCPLESAAPYMAAGFQMAPYIRRTGFKCSLRLCPSIYTTVEFQMALRLCPHPKFDSRVSNGPSDSAPPYSRVSNDSSDSTPPSLRQPSPT